MTEKCKFDNYEQFLILFAAMIHDTDHPGFNNVFLSNTKNKLAVRYNDVAVLENHSLALSFDLMMTSAELDILL